MTPDQHEPSFRTRAGATPGDVGIAADRSQLSGPSAVNAYSWPDVLVRLSSALDIGRLTIWSETDLSQMRAVRALSKPPQSRPMVIGHPQMSRRALKLDKRAGLTLLMTLHEHQHDSSHIHVRSQHPRVVWLELSNAAVQALAKQPAQRLKRALAAV